MDVPEPDKPTSGTSFTAKLLRTFKKRLKTASGLHKILKSLRAGAIFQMKIYSFMMLGKGTAIVMALKNPQDRHCPSH